MASNIDYLKDLRNYDMNGLQRVGGSAGSSGSDSYGSQQQISSTDSYGQSGSTSDSYSSSHTEGGSSSSSRGGSDSHSKGGSSSSSLGGSTSTSVGGSDAHTAGGSRSRSIGGSNAHSEGGSNSSSVGGSNATSKGGSTSSSVGGSTASSRGGSTGTSSSVGGNTQTGYGKSWASGQVSDRTQQMFDQSTQGYVRSQAVEDAYANLQNSMNNKPTFQSKYEDKLNDMYDRIMNREAFSYDFNKDAMYQQYRDMYQQQGRRAMQDTMGQLAAMNNGYGSSYAQSAGQQAYQGYLQELNNRLPELRQQALEEYDREGNRLNQQYQLTNDAYNREYGQYRDLTGDWQSDRSFNQGMYSDERNFDYNQMQNDRAFWQNEYWQERNAEQSNMNQSTGTNWNDAVQNSTNWSDTNSQNWSDTNSTNWNNTSASNWNNTNSTNWNDTNSSNWNNTNSRNWSDTSSDNWSTSASQNWQDTNSENWNDTSSTNWNDTNSRNWSDTNSQTHTDTTGWNTNHTDSISNSTNENHQTGWNNNNTYGSGSSGRSSSSDALQTVAWSRDTTGGTDYNSASIAQQLYYAYKDGGDAGLNEVRADLKANGLVVGDTKYTFTNKDLDELEKKAKIISSQMRDYRNG